MTDHDAARELAASAMDFDLSPEDDTRLLAHVVGCASCRAFVEALDGDRRAIAGLDAADAPEQLRSRVLEATAGAIASGFEATVPAPTEARRRHRIRAAGPVIPGRYRWPLVLTTAAVIIVALIAGGLVWRPAPTGPDVAAGSPSAAAPSGAPLPSIEPGSRLAASPWTQVADLSADDAAGGVVALAGGFRLTSLDGTPAVAVAARLSVEPPIAFSVTADADGAFAHITPSVPLTPGTVYHFTLAAADGRTVGSWAFQAHQPLRIVASVPADTETDVPLDTGIEVTFDQDGVVDAADHLTISPAVSGRIEQHGRVTAFVPDEPLAPATIYSVTVSPGIEVGATGERLEQGVTFRFETAAQGAPAAATTFQFSDDLFESSTTDRPVIGVWAFQEAEDEGSPPPPPTSAPIEVYRIGGLDAAMDVYRGIRAYPRWSRFATTDLVPIAGLSRVMALDARLQDSQGVLWTELPERLPAGWYLIQLTTSSRPIQAMLQVTDIASYLVVSDTKTLLWTNDLATGGPLAGAVAATGGSDLGRTGADGTLTITTPRSVVPKPLGECPVPCVAFITVRDADRAAFVPASQPSDPEGKGFTGWGPSDDVGFRYWHTLGTDRSLYRTTDTVNTWGVIRDRDSGAVPDVVTISLTALDGDTSESGPPLVTNQVHPDSTGVFATSVALTGLPEGSYQLELRTADQLVTTTGFQVGRILKPAYKLDVVTGRRVYVEGDQIRVTAHATFYEGSPVPGVALRAEGVLESTLTTDATGTATKKTTAHIDPEESSDSGAASIQSISVTPATAEEGEIASSSRQIVVFPSHWTIDATAEVTAGRVRASGVLSEIDRDRLEREVSGGADPWSLDPAGKVLAGRTVTLTFTDLITTRVKSGTHYDFIEKKVVPTYEYDTTERVVRTTRVTTDSKGRFAASITATAGHAYRINIRSTDTDGHVARWAGLANQADTESLDQSYPVLALTADPAMSGAEFGVGDRIDITMSDPHAGGTGASGRYLFYTAQRGLRDVVVQDSARFRTTFDASAPPNLQIGAVRFDGSRYSGTTAFEATFRSTDRRLTVGLSTDATRYAPGADVHLTVTTRDPSGAPVAATVVIRAVDEKLFGLGGAEGADPLGEIYAGIDSGIRVTYRSHRSPRSSWDNGWGDTTGGGRDDFRDSLLFKTVETGSDGRTSVTMHLSDDLTSWHVSASAIGAGLTAGEGAILVPVGLAFFADATIAPEYLVSDRPEIGIRAFGTALTAASAITFAVDSDSLGLHVSGLKADAFDTIRVSLPALSLGRHAVTVTARTGSGSTAREDRLTRTFTVVTSRLERTRTAYQEITGVSHVQGGDGLTEVTVSDAGVGGYAPLLLELADPASGRLENVLAGALAGSIAGSRFALPATAAAFDGAAYQTPDGGLSVVPYASSDLEASVIAALVAPDRFDVSRLTSYLRTISGDEKETRERRDFALAGLAGLGVGVLPELRAAATVPDITIRERLMLGLGAAALGDAATAHAIAAGLIAEYGEAVGEQARLRVGSDAADVTEATALMALLTASNDDALAPRFWAYVQANPDRDATYALHAVGFVTRMLEYAAPTPASFAYTADGVRTVVELGPGEAFHATILPTQLAAFSVEPVSGRVAVTTSWREPVDPAAFAADPDVKISRTVTPSGVIGTSDLVKVDLLVDLGPRPNSGCHLVTDFVPSGLVPVGSLRGWVDPDEEQGTTANTAFPYAQVGQRVYFCAEPQRDGGDVRLRYVARVISTGTYTWETAIAQSPFATDRAALTGATKITIR